MKAVFMSVALGALAFSAQAAPVSDDALRLSFNACTDRCTAAHSFGFCAETCGCMTGEMSRHLDQEEFDRRRERVRTDPDDPMIDEELKRMAEFCAARIQ